MKEIENHFMELGFTLNEARAYIALLSYGEMTGYELSKNSEIPSATIYKVIQKLLDKGAIYVVEGETPKYEPIPLEELVYKISNRYDSHITSLHEELCKIEKRPSREQIYSIYGYDHQIEKLKFMIEKAKKCIFISAGPQEVEWIRESLQEVKKRQVDVYIFSFEEVDSSLGENFTYHFPKGEMEKWTSNFRITAVIDFEEAILLGQIEEKLETCIYSKNPLMVKVLLEGITNDIRVLKLKERFNLLDPDNQYDEVMAIVDQYFVYENKKAIRKY